MRRKKYHDSREKQTPDPKYDSMLITKLINKILMKGKKTVAERVVYEALEKAGKKLNYKPAEALDKALANIRPILEVKSRRVGGATYQVPIEVSPERSLSLGLRWLVQYSRARKGLPMDEKLANEIVSACKREGSAVKKKEDTHKMAEANRAFAHYKW